MNNIYREYSLPNHSINFREVHRYNAKTYSSDVKHSNHEEYEIYWFVEGDMFFSFEGLRIDIVPGDMIILCGRQVHRVIIKGHCDYHQKRIKYKEEIFDNMAQSGFLLRKQLQKEKIIHLNAQEVRREQLDKLFLDIECKISHNTPYDQFCACVSLFSFLIKACELGERDEDQVSVYTGKAYEIIKYIDAHIDTDLSYKVLSERFFISEKNLYNYFKKETGFSLGKYITGRRIVKAKATMLAGASATDAAIAAGFSDYSVFYRNFLKETGTTPANFAKNIAGY